MHKSNTSELCADYESSLSLLRSKIVNNEYKDILLYSGGFSFLRLLVNHETCEVHTSSFCSGPPSSLSLTQEAVRGLQELGLPRLRQSNILCSCLSPTSNGRIYVKRSKFNKDSWRQRTDCCQRKGGGQFGGGGVNLPWNWTYSNKTCYINSWCQRSVCVSKGKQSKSLLLIHPGKEKLCPPT